MSENKDPVASARLLPGPGSLMSSFVVALATVPLGLFLFSLMGRYFFFAELVCNFRCQIMFMLIPFTVLLFLMRRTWLCLVLFGALIWSMVGIAWVYLPGVQPPPGPQVIRLMSYNVMASNQNFVDTAKHIIDTDADVVVIIEYAQPWVEPVAALADHYPYQVLEPRWHGFGMAILSKYPLTDTRVLSLTKRKTDNPFIMTTVEVGEQRIRLAGIHVLSPTNRFRLGLRNSQFQEAAELLALEDIPTVVMGDFNCTPWSSFLDRFIEETDFRDSRQGFGYHATWPNQKYWLVAIPIDHAFVSSHIHVHDRRVGKQCGSDHNAIVLDISTTGKRHKPHSQAAELASDSR